MLKTSFTKRDGSPAIAVCSTVACCQNCRQQGPAAAPTAIQSTLATSLGQQFVRLTHNSQSTHMHNRVLTARVLACAEPILMFICHKVPYLSGMMHNLQTLPQHRRFYSCLCCEPLAMLAGMTNQPNTSMPGAQLLWNCTRNLQCMQQCCSLMPKLPTSSCHSDASYK